MNSNLTPHLRAPVHIRTAVEFGVRDSTGQVYSNIKDYFLTNRILYLADFIKGSINSPNKQNQPYQLNVDKNLREELIRYGKAYAIISFQRKTEGFFAVARLFTKERIK